MKLDNGLTLPQIIGIKLNSFSLYTLEPDIETSLAQGVFCLAGANGLGKSTFLAALNYALTGIVRNPNRKFNSMEDYYRDELSVSYSQEYFQGRISEQDRESSAISVSMRIGKKVYDITRGVFQPEELRILRIVDQAKTETIIDDTSVGSKEMNDFYKLQVAEDIGLSSFEQFVFLQHFVFTFDESRFLLLWDKRALNTAVYLCVGADLNKVKESERLLRQMEKAASRARNFNWQASIVRNEIQILKESLGTKNTPKQLEIVFGQHKALQTELEVIQKKFESKKAQLSDKQLLWAEQSAEVATLQAEYNKQFDERIQKRVHVRSHPTIIDSINSDKCVICGVQSSEVTKTLKTKIESNRCPLCNSSLPKQKSDATGFERLKEIDSAIAKKKMNMESVRLSTERISRETASLVKKRDAVLEKLEDFENANEATLYTIKAKASGGDKYLENKLAALEENLRKKKAAYLERDKKKSEYLLLQRDLERMYVQAQNKFVPLFRDLAFLFLGIDVDIRMEFSTQVDSPGVSLTLEMQGKVRRQDYELSESQRFFVDIALRMAIAQYMSKDNLGATLFIDTPEGSLDIAYESRVGQMFAQFVGRGNNIIMTANINSSQILRKLASMCGKSTMTLQRMTSWTELTEVQMEESLLFSEALEKIESALSGK